MQSAEFAGGHDKDVSVSAAWPPFHWLERPDIQPIVDDFWRLKYDEHDLAMYNRFLEILRLSHVGLNGEEIGRRLRMNNVRKFLAGEKKSFLTHLRAEHDRLGPPGPGRRWLPLRLKPRGTPDKDWIQVPVKVINFDTINSVLRAIEPPVIDEGAIAQFGYSSLDELMSDRPRLLGFLFGTTVGDAGKRIKGTTKFFSRTLALELSTNKPNSLRFGEFTALCANATLNLEMHRIGDGPISDKRYGKSEIYRWITASSPLVAWIFNECLGLENDETTTYDSLRADWLSLAPTELKIAFLQGIAESDGWPDAGQDRVKIVASPNTGLFKGMLESLGCTPLVVPQPPVELLSTPTEQAITVPMFSPRIASDLYEDMKVLAGAKRFPERVRLPSNIVDLIRNLAKRTSNANEICLEIARLTGYKISGQTVRKYAGL